MQYIQKQNTPPIDWEKWFTTGNNKRSFDYATDYGSLRYIAEARQYLIDEQKGLCAYCQQKINSDNSSIEHIIPKEFNKELSTNYFNLVAVCKTTPKDSETQKYHCDKQKGSVLISPIIFNSNSDVTKKSNSHFFRTGSDGQIRAKENLSDEVKKQVESFIDIVNLNHKQLREKRTKDVLDGLINAYHAIPKTNHQKCNYWEVQFDRIYKNNYYPFRQFLLIYISTRLGRN